MRPRCAWLVIVVAALVSAATTIAWSASLSVTSTPLAAGTLPPPSTATPAFRQSVGNNSTNTSVTSLSVTVGADTLAASLLVLRSSGTTYAITAVSDSRGNTWTRVAAGSATNGSDVWATKMNSDHVRAGDQVTASYGTSPTSGKAISVEEFTGVGQVAATQGVNTSGSSTTPSATLSSSIPSGHLVIGQVGVKGPTTDVYTEDADATGGSWIALTPIGTSGGSATSNFTNNAAYKITTAADAQSYRPTLGTSRDWTEHMVHWAPP